MKLTRIIRHGMVGEKGKEGKEDQGGEWVERADWSEEAKEEFRKRMEKN